VTVQEAIGDIYKVYSPLTLRGNLVLGEGNFNSPVAAFVGEAPGKMEDLKKRPFQGPAGVVFDRLLQSIGLDRKEIYVTNLVKIRPRTGNRNRAPEPREVRYSLSFLVDELNLVQPKVVVTLGRIPQHAFTRDSALGRLIEEPEIIRVSPQDQPQRLFCCNHPASALYDPTGVTEEKMIQQFKGLWGVLNKV
jgi:uracil-DNA glycosylase